MDKGANMKRNENEDGFGVLGKMFRSGKLGKYPVCLDRFRSGVRLMRDYGFSSFVPKVTMSYGETAFIKGGNFGADEWNGGRRAAAQKTVARKPRFCSIFCPTFYFGSAQ